MLPFSRSMRNVIDLPFGLTHDGLRAWKLVRKTPERFNSQRLVRGRERERGRGDVPSLIIIPRFDLGERVPRSIKSS